MQRILTAVVTAGLTVCPVLASPTAAAANYPLEIASPRDDLPAQHRIYQAYPGISYNIRAAVIGGLYPYAFELDSGPDGMSIDARTGEITWPDPQGDATATFTVCDSEGTMLTETWAIAVATDGFLFVDANAADAGDGSLASPFNGVEDFYLDDKWDDSYAGHFVYFRSGSYQVSSPDMEDGGTVLHCDGDRKPVVWLAYPGDDPLFDLEEQNSLRFQSSDVYLDGLGFEHMDLYGVQISSGSSRSTFRRLSMQGLSSVSSTGANNQSFIRLTGHTWGEHMVIQDCRFEDMHRGSGLKLYPTEKMLIEDNVFAHFPGGDAIHVKESIRRFTIRGNEIYDMTTGSGIAGNMADWEGTPTADGEYLYNLIYDVAGSALTLNNDGVAGEHHVYRNTLLGRVSVFAVDTADGPFRLYDNVIVNDDADGGDCSGWDGCNLDHVHYGHQCEDLTRVILEDNLTGFPADGVVDASAPFHLSAAHSDLVGQRGHQVDPNATFVCGSTGGQGGQGGQVAVGGGGAGAGQAAGGSAAGSSPGADDADRDCGCRFPGGSRSSAWPWLVPLLLGRRLGRRARASRPPPW